jgi:hypothetical protein
MPSSSATFLFVNRGIRQLGGELRSCIPKVTVGLTFLRMFTTGTSATAYDIIIAAQVSGSGLESINNSRWVAGAERGPQAHISYTWETRTSDVVDATRTDLYGPAGGELPVR